MLNTAGIISEFIKKQRIDNAATRTPRHRKATFDG